VRVDVGVAGAGVEVIEGGGDEPGDIDLRNAPSPAVAPARVAATSRSMNATTSATARWCASPMSAWTPASATAHSTDADFGMEKVKSKPATARRVL